MLSAVEPTPRPYEGFILARLPKQGWSHDMTTDLQANI